MKVNGYILTYPLGYTNIEGSSGDDSEAMQAIQRVKEELIQRMEDLDADDVTTSMFEQKINEVRDGLQALLKMKANLVQTAGQDTPDDETDDKFQVDPKELPSNGDDNWIEG